MGTADTPVTVQLQLVDNPVDAKSGTVRVRAMFDNADSSLIPGQFAKLRMDHVMRREALMVDERAVGTDRNNKFVMVVGNDNRAAYREIALDARANGLRRVRPGALVEPQPVAMKIKTEALCDAAAHSSRESRFVNLSHFFIDQPMFAGALSLLIFLGGLIELRDRALELARPQRLRQAARTAGRAPQRACEPVAGAAGARGAVPVHRRPDPRARRRLRRMTRQARRAHVVHTPRRRFTNATASRPASISAYVSGSGTAAVMASGLSSRILMNSVLSGPFKVRPPLPG